MKRTAEKLTALLRQAQAAPAGAAAGRAVGGEKTARKGPVLTAMLFAFLMSLSPGAAAKNRQKPARCQDVFASSQSPLKPYLTEDPQDPRAASLVRGYKIAQKEHWTGRKKELRGLEAGMLNFIQFLEKSPSRRERMAPISPEFLSGSLQKIPEITAFANQTEGAEGVVFQQTAQAVFAAFGKHLPAALKAEDWTKVNWGGLNFVLQSIAEFDIEANPAFSLYKIRRAVKRQWSLREFILCR